MPTEVMSSRSASILEDSPYPHESTPSFHSHGKSSVVELTEVSQVSGPSKHTSIVVGSTDRVSTPTAIDGKARRRANIQFAAMCFTLFLAGWNDGTTGPLLPRIQEVYHVCLPRRTIIQFTDVTLRQFAGRICCRFAHLCV